MANRECGGVLGAKKVFLVALATLPIGNSLTDSLTNTFRDLWSPMVWYVAIWSHMVPYGPLWSRMDPYGPVWFLVVSYVSLCSLMVTFPSLWSHLVLFAQFNPVMS